MYLHESNRAANDLARSIIVILIVETMHALRMVHQSELDVFGQRPFHKAIDRVIHRWNFVMPGTANEHRRNFARVLFEIGDWGKSSESFRGVSLAVVRLLYVHEGIKADQTTHERSVAAHRQRQHRPARRESD